jgi:hypothetical protein
VIGNNPPYALAATPFRFAALATLAGRAPLGGQREVALATYLTARLAQDVLPECGVSQASRAERAGSARSWLATLALPTTVRPALSRVAEASATDPRSTAEALRTAMTVVAPFLDTRARSELDRLATSLAAE